MQNLTLEQFRGSYEAGGVVAITLIAEGPSFELQIETLRGTVKLVKSRSKGEARRFTDPRQALKLLRELGIHELRINSEHWRPNEAAAPVKPRPVLAAVTIQKGWQHQTGVAAGTKPLKTNEALLDEVDEIFSGKPSVK